MSAPRILLLDIETAPNKVYVWGMWNQNIAANQVVEDGYEFFQRRQLVTLFSAPNYCGEFDNSGAMMTVDDTLMCSFQILKPTDKRKNFG